MTNPGSIGVLYVAEPQTPYLQRPAVVDCSVFSALLWAEPAAELAAERLSGFALHAPSLLPYELANVARSKARSGVPSADALAGLEAFAEQAVVLQDVEPERQFKLALRFDLTAYDAAYLCLAEQLQAPLITFDKRLADAAQRHLGAAP
jgi:predicted nucleic acid-binding protein